MFKKLIIICAAALVLFSACPDEYDDSGLKNRLTALEERMDILEDWQDAVNIDIAGFQALLEAQTVGDYISGISEYDDGTGYKGYIIEFMNSSPIIIHHGRNGADGEDGNHGTTPVVSAIEEEGVWYWTINGEKIDDGKGGFVKAIGIAGTAGNDGITPQIRINTETEEWEYSLDNGSTWTSTGVKAVGPKGDTGAQGSKGDKGDAGGSFFSDIDYETSEDYVVFTLADGTTTFTLPTNKKITEIEARITALETKVNANIEALEGLTAAAEAGKYITDVSPVTDGNGSGFKISFNKGTPITIYHGDDGEDGENGTNGTTPIVSAAKETDDVLYWQVNGEWLLDGGSKIPVTGAQGTAGTDGITPQIRINTDTEEWEYSLDNGSSWTSTGVVAVGADGEDGEDGAPGAQGSKGDKGDSFFYAIDTTSKDYVVFTLADETTTFTLPTNKKITEIEARITALETKVNANIEALAGLTAAAEAGKYITGVEETTGGFVISFNKGTPITIYHGDDGEDGENGTNGTTPIVSAAKDIDDVLYWQVNGEWLLDGGSKIPVTGAQGTAGNDGITPQIRINSGTKEWEYSLDNKATWTSTGVVAVGADGEDGEDGAPGQQGPKGDKGDAGGSFFSDIDYETSEDYVEFTLAGEAAFRVPKYVDLGITFDAPGTFDLGETKDIPITLAGGASEITFLNVLPGWSFAAIISGNDSKITITAPEEEDLDGSNYAGGTAIILVSDGKNRTIFKQLNYNTLVFYYDKIDAFPDWDFLEAAPEDAGQAQWGANEKNVATTGTAIGTGKANTAAIVEFLKTSGEGGAAETGRAAQLCAEADYGGHDDWFLPSIDELNELYTNLARKSLGGFSSVGFYWSSSENENYSTHSWVQLFRDGNQYSNYKDNTTSRVRPVRAF